MKPPQIEKRRPWGFLMGSRTFLLFPLLPLACAWELNNGCVQTSHNTCILVLHTSCWRGWGDDILSHSVAIKDAHTFRVSNTRHLHCHDITVPNTHGDSYAHCLKFINPVSRREPHAHTYSRWRQLSLTDSNSISESFWDIDTYKLTHS